jgi:hypothetical protein
MEPRTSMNAEAGTFIAADTLWAENQLIPAAISRADAAATTADDEDDLDDGDDDDEFNSP